MKGQSIKRLSERGLCLTRLRFQYTYTGLYGRTILVFEGESLSRAQTFGPGWILKEKKKKISFIIKIFFSQVILLVFIIKELQLMNKILYLMVLFFV